MPQLRSGLSMCLRSAALGAVLACALATSRDAAAAGVSAQAQANFATIDAMQVEQRWPAGQHVQWESGVPDGRPEGGTGKHTHCSAFVAAAAKRLGVYILRPPEHSQVLLANAQVDWLDGDGARQGWQPIADAGAAQAAANRGLLVVAAYRNHHDDKPGHIAIVRPGEPSREQLLHDGPQITQAGGHNYLSTSLRQGFAGHPAAWGHAEVRFYAHAVPAR